MVLEISLSPTPWHHLVYMASPPPSNSILSATTGFQQMASQIWRRKHQYSEGQSDREAVTSSDDRPDHDIVRKQSNWP
jgi:hypothetical protein